MRKKLLIMGLVALFATFQAVKAQIAIPQPSAKAKTETTVGLTDISISYYRPSVKGRAIFGEGSDYLQPYGQLWRAGANSGTVLSLSTDAKVAGKDVKAGDYLIFMTPGKDQWEFKLYSDLSLGGNVGGYNMDNEVLSAKVTPKKLSEPVETLTYQISDLNTESTKANIHFMWENQSVKVPVEVTYDEIVMAQIEKNTKVNPSNLIAAANYYYNTGKDLNQALEWVNTYLAAGNNSQQFWNVHLKAQILAKLGKNKEAKQAAEKSMALAKANEGGDFGYVKRNQDLIAGLGK
ncbi:hypothetical protein GCM10011506_42870 [Marivirga lumbricoides]|uniref:DUF2911 domain-containing protein n=1 Tax=Marivirga lumbricoides TaxID=1046115 RepID=A0A2T4DKZ7_9BACT|nr:hypothetical protein C9994_12090 [Marivirga lumbricoides]GGC52661.1 hypothetical protein GCM10011506_42870 [Marivirga lumbricoides]